MIEVQLFFGLIFMIGGAILVIGGIALAVSGVMGLLKGQHDPYDYPEDHTWR